MAEWVTAMGTIVMAIGTIVVCVLAIWGEWIKALFFRPRLTLVVPDAPPLRIDINPPRYYAHLRLRNDSKTTGRNCRVMLRGVQMKAPQGRFDNVHVPIPLQFTWSPSEMPPLQRDVTPGADEVVDLGFVSGAGQQPGRFQPQFYVTPRGHDYGFAAGGAARYFLDVVADNSVSPVSQVFEVFWDGQWDDDPEAMRRHLQVSDVTHGVQ